MHALMHALMHVLMHALMHVLIHVLMLTPEHVSMFSCISSLSSLNLIAKVALFTTVLIIPTKNK